MALGQPLGLLALLAIPALLALYFLRRKRPPRTVSALFLWRGPDPSAEAGPRWRRLAREGSLALEIAAALAATAFLGDLRCEGRAPERHAVLVLDGSLSMGARLPGGGSVAGAALERARRTASDRGRLTVVESGLEPRIVLGPAAPATAVRGLAFSPSGPSHDLTASLALAREIAGAGARITLLTDRPVEPAPPGVEVIALGRPLENSAFTAAHRRDREGRARLFLRVAHFGVRPATLPLEVRGPDGEVLFRRELALGPGEEATVEAEVAALPEVTAVLPDDALPEDGRVLLLGAPRRSLRIGLELPDGPAARSVRRLLAADGDAAVAAPPDLSFAAADASPGPWRVLLGPRGAAPRSSLGPFFPDKGHPLLEGVPLDGLVWSHGAGVPGRPLLTDGTTVVVSEEPGPVFRIDLDLARSNLHRTPAWPVLLSNLLALRREAMAGFARPGAVLGEELVVHLDPGARWSFSGPAGELPLPGSGRVRLPPPRVPGTYRLLRDGQTADRTVVQAMDPLESDLRDRLQGEQPTSSPMGRIGAEGQGRAGWPLLLLAALLCADWALTGRRPALARPGGGGG